MHPDELPSASNFYRFSTFLRTNCEIIKKEITEHTNKELNRFKKELEKLKELEPVQFNLPQELLKAHQVYITKNEHHTNYESIEAYLKVYDDLEEISSESLEKCIETDTLWEIQWYPSTPNGFYKVYGDSLETCFKIINENKWN